jgi:hypothetical protein
MEREREAAAAAAAATESAREAADTHERSDSQ